MRMMVVLCAALLAGCGVTQTRLDDFVDPADVVNPARYRADYGVCKDVGLARFGQLQGYTPKPSLEDSLIVMQDETRRCLQEKGYKLRPLQSQPPR